MSGPDIFIDNITDLMMGEKANFAANISDISGVDTVTGLLALPDGSTESITLHSNGNIYKGSYQTSLDSQLGEYTLLIVANDTYGNINSANKTFNVIHAYLVTLNDINDAYQDDGDTVPGNNINIALPSGNSTLSLKNGSYDTKFAAPSPGAYQIKAWIVVGNREFSATKTLNVKVRQNSGGHGGGSGGGGHSTTVMPPDNSGILSTECVNDSDCNQSEQCRNGECVAIPKEIVIGSEKEKLEPAPAEPGVNPNAAVNVTEKWDEKNVGVGRATGFFNLEKISWASLLWIIIAIIAVVLVIKLLSGKTRQRGRGINYSVLETYIDNQRKKSR